MSENNSINNSQFIIYSINGPVVKVHNAGDLGVQETVYVGGDNLIGEVISNDNGTVTIQVYESTAGLKVGEPVFGTGSPMSLLLGPGIISNIFDGIQRPLKTLEADSGMFITKGSAADKLDKNKKWDVKVVAGVGKHIEKGQFFAECRETSLVINKVMATVSGEVESAVPDGSYTITDTVITVRDEFGELHPQFLAQYHPMRVPRPIKERLPLTRPLITGQRIIDSLFPIAKGGAAAIPGGFGTGKTITQHQLAKWSDADIIVYIGCGERGNEMTQVLEEFAELVDPKTGKPMTDRTVLIANTSNMPVAAREASVYTGITIAEYYRDMGYHVALMADSTSRWAEALREISGRLEEMPAEEGYPAYLPSRLAEFYERGGYVRTLSGDEGSVTLIGAVSPQGSDFSEPVTQNTKRFIRCFWALDKSLAYARHYPAINWTESYSEYVDDLSKWYENNVDKSFMELRGEIVRLLNEESALMEIVKLIGADVLPDDQRLIIEIAKVIRIGFLQQNAMNPVDTCVPIRKQFLIMDVILYLYRECKKIIAKAIPISRLMSTGLFEKLIRIKYDIDNENIEKIPLLKKDIDKELSMID